MTFFLIVPSVMLLSSLLVYAICNKLGLRLHFFIPIMCSLLAIAADLGALAFTDAPSKIYFVKLVGIIFFMALLTTVTNYFLIKREVQAEIAFSEEVKQVYNAQRNEKITVDTGKSEITAPEVESDNSAVGEPENLPEPEIPKPKSVEEIKPTIQVEEIKPTVQVEEKISEPKPETKPVELTQPEPAEIQTPPKKPAYPQPPEKLENIPPLNIEVKGETLDDILDYAYLEKQQGNTWQAIAAYKKALEKYRADEYAPFVAIDLGNIYKEQAFYTKAIKTYEEALELPAVKRNANTTAEFKSNLIYLKTVQSVLLRHKALSTPFSKISRAYLQEIELEYQNMQMKSES